MSTPKAFCILALTATFGWAGLIGLADEAPTEWTWYENDALPLEGRPFADGETYFCRLPKRAQGKVEPGLYKSAKQATGMCLRFTTDANRIALNWKIANEHPTDALIPIAGLCGLDVYRYDRAEKRWRFLRTCRYWGNAKTLKTPGEAVMPWTPGEPCLIYLTTRSQLLRFKLGVPKGTSIAYHPHAQADCKPIVHYGTSIVHGGCASRAGLMFTSIAARELDMPYVNMGFSGRGKMQPEMAPFLGEIDASLYIVDCCWNMSPALVQTNAVRFLTTLHDMRPNTPILLCDGCNARGVRRPVDDAMKAVYTKLKAQDGARWRNLHYFDNATMLPKDDECTHDFCHPNDSGMRFMGPAYAKRIREVLEGRAQ